MTGSVFPLLDIGWYTGTDPTQPAHDPGFGACPLCGWPVIESRFCTVYIQEPGQPRTIFYRLHSDCANARTPELCQEMDVYALSLAPKGDA